MRTKPSQTKFAVCTTFLATFSCAALAETVSCGDSQVSVTFQRSEHATAVCNTVEQSETLFEQCNVPRISRPVTVNIVEDLKAGCVAIYHCDENDIEILTPSLMQERRKPDGAFADLSNDEYFKSVVVHELTHAASDNLSCPFQSCVAAEEYIAYSMQIMSLDPQSQAQFEDRSGLARRISSDELSAIILFMAPDLFAQKAWAHLLQQKDACHYIGQLVEGHILLDRGHF